MVDRQSLARFGTRSTAVIPLVAGAAVLGGLAVGTARGERRWPDELIPRLRLLADVFAHALARQRAERTANERTAQIQTLAGQLITAQEAERGRIARIVMPGLDGISATVALLARFPDTCVVLVTVHDDARLAERGYAAGALACVLKLTAADELMLAVRRALRGERSVSLRLRDPPV